MEEEVVILNEENLKEIIDRTGLPESMLRARLVLDIEHGVKSAYFFTRYDPKEDT